MIGQLLIRGLMVGRLWVASTSDLASFPCTEADDVGHARVPPSTIPQHLKKCRVPMVRPGFPHFGQLFIE